MSHPSFLIRLLRGGLAVTLLLAVLAGSAGGARPAAAQAAPEDGVVCTTSANNTFTLTTRTGYIGTPDDNVVFMWGFSAGGNPFQHPGPVLCVTEGATVTVILQNTLPNDDVSIIFPGQENVLADGAPAQPQFDAGNNLVSLTKAARKGGGSVTYSFVAGRAGTYIYQSGTNPAKQVHMGLFGALIVRPNRAGYVYAAGDNAYNPSREYMVLLSEIDPLLNQAVERNRPFNFNNYKPRYFMINGRGFPDSIAANFASWLPTQPYGALARINPYDAATNPLPALVRYLNVSSVSMPFHPHGNHGRVVGRDGYPLTGAGGQDLSFQKFTVNVGPGQTWDVTFDWRDAEQYSTGNPVPVAVPDFQSILYGGLYSGSPYLGTTGQLPVGQPVVSECGEYYIIAHNHALFQMTSWGVPMTGPVTFLRVDPPTCQ